MMNITKKKKATYSPLSSSSSSSSGSGLFTIIDDSDNDDDEDDSDNDDNNNNNRNDYKNKAINFIKHSSSSSSDSTSTIMNNDNDDNDINNNNSSNDILLEYRLRLKQLIKHCLIYLDSLKDAITYGWMKKLLAIGNERPLEQCDLYPLPYPDTAIGVCSAFRYYWTDQLKKHKKQSSSSSSTTTTTPSLALAFFNAFGYPFLACGFLKLIHDSCVFLGPVFLNKLIGFLNDPNEPISTGLFYVLGLFLANLTMSLCLRMYFWWCFRIGMRLRSAVITSIYSKALVISASVLLRRTTGEITNLMSVDSSRLQDLTPYMHAIWYSFYQIFWALYFLWQQVGASALAGVFVMLLTIPLTNQIAQLSKSLQKKISTIRDERVKMSNEVLSGMKVIKFQAWEKECEERLGKIREKELSLFWKYSMLQCCSGALYATVPLLVGIFTFTAYIAVGNDLDVATALTSLALFEILRFPLYMLPNVINNIVEAQVSFNRIQSFLLEKEQEVVPSQEDIGCSMTKATVVWDVDTTKNDNDKSTTNVSLDFKTRFLKRAQGIFDYISGNSHARLIQQTKVSDVRISSSASLLNQLNPDEVFNYKLQKAQLYEAEKIINKLQSEVNILKGIPISETDDVMETDAETQLLTLSRVDFKASNGEVIAIVGQVGSGKSSIMSALLGDMKLTFGQIGIKGRIAYAGQRPFIQNCTLRDNIYFGSQPDKHKYEQTLYECALLPDLKVLPAGDLTEIGERGINLSGGQKARVSIARAVYSDADVYLLDDVLAAVDAHVGQHLFENCIMNLQKRGKCVILVTNALQFLPSVNRIYVLKDGRVIENGTYSELVASKGAFTAMVDTHFESMGTQVKESSDDDSTKAQIMQTSNNDHIHTDIDDDDDADNKSLIKKDDTKEDNEKKGVLVKDEEREVGDVNYSVYQKWSITAGGVYLPLILLSLYGFGEFFAVLSSWWLSFWSEHKNTGSPWYYLRIYILINFAVSLFALGREMYVRAKSWKAAEVLYRELVSGVLYSPMSFFDSTPLGRILNRFSKDTYVIDEQLPNTVRWYTGSMAKIFGVIVYISIVTPLFILGLIPIAIGYYVAQRYYIKTSRELTRLDSLSRSPIYALFSETLDGLTTIRAYKQEERFFQRNNKALDANQQAYYLNFSCNCWLGVRLEFAGTLIITFAALFAVLGRNYYIVSENGITNTSTAFAGMAGLSISLALAVTQSLNWSVRMASDLESQMVSVERVMEYASLEQERPHVMPDDPPPEWPTSGAMEFNNVKMRYRAGLPLVLHGVNLSIKAREKIGVVGRTGAGKSSLVTALLRLVELAEGSIIIDGVDISKVGLNTLRSRISIIPQDPILFSGTIRSNLDPFQRYTDNQIWDGLRRCQLVPAITSLEDVVSENGGNYSVGQRQLLCICRALLSSAKLIIMDEATAAIDVETDALIQRSIRSEFIDATCLVIAHRLNTILDSDKILVMDNGRVQEFDTPSNLLRDTSSSFSSLVNNWEQNG